MFTFVVPLGCVLLCQSLLRPSSHSKAWTGWIGIVTGVLSLAYGSFCIWILAGLMALALCNRVNDASLTFRGFIWQSVLLAMGFAFPALGWILTCKLVFGGYHNPELAQYRQFIWVLDSVRFGVHHFLYTASLKWAEFLEVVFSVAGLPTLVLGAVVFAGFAIGAPIWLIIRERSLAYLSIGITIGASVFFFYFMGFYQARLELNVVLPFLLAAAILTVSIVERAEIQSAAPIAAVLVWAITILCLLYEVAKPFPTI